MAKFLVRKITIQHRYSCAARRARIIVGAWGVAADDQPPIAVIIAAAAPRARPDQSTLGSLVRQAGTGTNGERWPRTIGDRSPPFAPMPLPSFAHYRRRMGLHGESAPLATRNFPICIPRD